MSRGAWLADAVVVCFRLEPLAALRDEASREDAVESLDARDSEDDRGVIPGRCCDVIYGPRPLADLRGGAGE